MAIVLAGLWLTGAVISDDFRVSMALTALWFGLVTVAALVVWRLVPRLRLPVTAVALATIVLVGGYLGLSTLRDKTVDEAIAAGTAELTGSFETRAHTTTGTARVIEQADGSRVLALVDFRTDAGPETTSTERRGSVRSRATWVTSSTSYRRTSTSAR